MDFTLSGESKMMVKTAQDFAAQLIEPIVATIEEDDAFPDDILEKMARFGLILCGRESSDAATAQVGPQVAELLDLPQLTGATEVTVKNSLVRIRQKLEDDLRVLETSLPALITVEREINQPRIPPVDRMMEAYRDKEVQVLEGEDLGGDKEHLGLKGSPAQSRKVYSKKVTGREGTILEGEPDETARELIQMLKDKDLV